MTRTPLPALLLALALLAPRPAGAQITNGAVPPPADLGPPSASYAPRFIAQILPGNDPDAAMYFLQDLPMQSALRANDPKAFEQVFARATELKDMHDLVFGPDEPVQLRLAFFSRPDCQFCQRSTTMLEWVDRRLHDVGAPRKRELLAAYWDWTSLSDEQRRWLASNGADETAWKIPDLTGRREKLAEWAKGEAAAVLALQPKNPQEADAMQYRIYGLYQILGSAPVVPLTDRLQQVRAGLSGLDRAKAMIGGSQDSAVRQAYQDALKATDPAERLAALARVYDGLGKRDESVLAQAPPRAGQSFDAASRQRVASLLASGLMTLTAGTWAGQELRDFYATRPMSVAVGVPPFAALAWYQNDVLSFNEKYVEQYVRSQGRTLDDLAKDPALLQPLLREFVPVFVHEATHQRQDAFAKAAGIPFYNGEAAEKEAMMTEALFVLQKSRQDPGYADFLAQGQERSTFIKEALILSRRLQKDRADWFGETVMATHYPEYLSISGLVWCTILVHDRIAPPIEAELKRRAALPEDRRKALEDARDFKPGYPGPKEFADDLPSVGTKRLLAVVTQQKLMLEKSPDAYAAYVKRLQDVTALTDARLDELEHPKPKADAVPSPFSGGAPR